MAGKLKGLDPKAMLIDHGEKVVFGIAGLLVVLALVGTDWSAYDGKPSDITKKVVDARQVLQQQKWEGEERQPFILPADQQPDAIIDRLISPNISPDRFAFSTRISQTPWDEKEPLREPVMLALQQPIANDGRVLIHLAPTGDDLASTEAESAEEAEDPMEDMFDDENLPDEFRRRDRGLTAGGAGSEYGAGMAGGEYEYFAPELDYQDPAMMAGEYGGEYGGAMAGEYGEGSMMGGAAGPKLDGKGYPFVSVRAVFPYRDQIRKYSDAIHRPPFEAAAKFEILDFELQRQIKLDDDSWSEWRDVDIQVAMDVLASASGYDPEVVASTVTDSAMTMPLPARITGVWRKLATHPAIEKFELTEEQIQQEIEVNRRLLQKYQEEQQGRSETPVEKKGFANLVFDTRHIQSSLMGEDSAYGGSMYEMPGYEEAGMYESAGPGGYPGAGRQANNTPFGKLMEELTKVDDKEQAEKLREAILERVTVEGELLLFRYIDFDVEPGKTYRYRAKLWLRNPNYGRRIAEAGGLPHVVDGVDRPTPWSEPTNDVTVRENINYFVERVEEHRGRQHKVARMSLYQWDPDFGALVRDNLDVVVGQLIGGKSRPLVLKPAESTFEEEEYTFRSEDLLVDVVNDVRINLDDHPHLKLASTKGDLQIPEKALVADADGALRVLSPQDRSQSQARTLAERYYTLQEQQFEHLKERAAASEEMLSELGEYGEYSEMYSGAYGEGEMESMGRGRRTRNVMRKQTRTSRRGGGGRSSMP